MVQSITLQVQKKISKRILREISDTINSDYLKRQLRMREIGNRECRSCGTTTYDCAEPYERIPTGDLTLRRDGNDFYGPATGCDQINKLIVKAIAVKGIQKILRNNGVESVIDYCDVAPAEYKVLSRYRLTK